MLELELGGGKSVQHFERGVPKLFRLNKQDGTHNEFPANKVVQNCIHVNIELTSGYVEYY